jgi:NADPH-dependent 2,4-dienoyl-CoA reductase/sulfur reductase-like enzyme
MTRVLVVGGGPAGMSAARAAARAGADVVLVDGYAALGGQYHRGEGLTIADARVDVRTGHRVWRMEPSDDGFRALVVGRPAIEAEAVVLAPGAHDRPLPFPGWDLPGVMTPGGAQALVKGSGVMPGRRVLVAGTGPFLLAVAAQLGDSVVAVLEAHAGLARRWLRPGAAAGIGKGGELVRYVAALRRAGVPLRAGWGVVEARPGQDGAVAEADVAQLDASWREVPGTRRTVAVDTVCAGYGFVGALELPLQLGCRAGADPADGSPVIAVDFDGRSSVPGVFVAGEATGVGGADLARAEGEIAGASAAGARAGRRVRARRARLDAFARALRAAHAVPDGWAAALADDVVVCRCEEVTAGAIRHAVRDLGATDGRSVKLQTRAGMGLCQGRMCALNVNALTPGPPSVVTRPLAEPVTLGELAASPH